MNKSNRGFTLIELMIVVAILAILATWGYSSYRDTILKSHRSEGLGELLTIADKLERYYADQRTYVGATVGSAANAVHPASSENGYYTFSITSATAVQFTLTAAPQGGQTDDTKCGTFTLTSQGARTASGTDADKCW
jgi:type IV pilus assembly protein PilE